MKTQQGYLTRESGSWIGHYSQWQTDFATGRRKRVQKAFSLGSVSQINKTQARLVLRSSIAQDLEMGADSCVTLSWFIDNRWKPLREGTWRGNTQATNKYIFSHIIRRFGTVALQNIDPVEMQAWLNGLAREFSDSLVRHLRLYLKSIFLEAVEQDYLRKSPARLLRLPVLKPVLKPFLSLQQIQELLKKAIGRDRLLLRIVCATALRPSELFALRWVCFDSERSLLKITESFYRGTMRPFTKTTDEHSQERLKMVFLPDVLVRELQEWRNGAPDEAFIFPNENGKPINKENYRNRVLIPLAKRAGVPKLTFQILRRSVATHMQSLGSPQDIAGMLRHTRPQTAAEHYVQVIPESVKQTSERLASVILQ